MEIGKEDFVLKVYELALTLKGDLARVETEFTEYKNNTDAKITELKTNLLAVRKRLEEAEKAPMQKSQRIIWLVIETFVVGVLSFLGSMFLSSNLKK